MMWIVENGRSLLWEDIWVNLECPLGELVIGIILEVEWRGKVENYVFHSGDYVFHSTCLSNIIPLLQLRFDLLMKVKVIS